MKPSPLGLNDYFISDLHFSANSQFDPKREVLIEHDDFRVELHTEPEPDLRWHVTLKLHYQPAADSNVPYRFIVEIVGSFSVAEFLPTEKTDRLVRTNGAS